MGCRAAPEAGLQLGSGQAAREAENPRPQQTWNQESELRDSRIVLTCRIIVQCDGLQFYSGISELADLSPLFFCANFGRNNFLFKVRQFQLLGANFSCSFPSKNNETSISVMQQKFQFQMSML
jgi:hypothetical protein